MTLRRLCLLGTAFLLGFTAGGGVKFVYESTTFKQYDWGHDPIVANCYGSDFDERKIRNAIYYWNVRGYRTHRYLHNPSREICDAPGMIPGFIILRKAKDSDLEEQTLASTRRHTTGMSITAAEVLYRTGSYKLDLLSEHELGHAFGFAHTEQEGHIMHPMYNKMGNGFWIP